MSFHPCFLVTYTSPDSLPPPLPSLYLQCLIVARNVAFNGPSPHNNQSLFVWKPNSCSSATATVKPVTMVVLMFTKPVCLFHWTCFHEPSEMDDAETDVKQISNSTAVVRRWFSLRVLSHAHSGRTDYRRRTVSTQRKLCAIPYWCVGLCIPPNLCRNLISGNGTLRCAGMPPTAPSPPQTPTSLPLHPFQELNQVIEASNLIKVSQVVTVVGATFLLPPSNNLCKSMILTLILGLIMTVTITMMKLQRSMVILLVEEMVPHLMSPLLRLI